MPSGLSSNCDDWLPFILFCTLTNEWRVASVLKLLLEGNTGKSNEERERKKKKRADGG